MRLCNGREVIEETPEVVLIEPREEPFDHDIPIVLQAETDVVSGQIQFEQDPAQLFACCSADFDRF